MQKPSLGACTCDNTSFLSKVVLVYHLLSTFEHILRISFTDFTDVNASWAIFLLCLISRQVEANIRRSTEYRRYNLLLPEFLHNRPYLFTKHCVCQKN